MHVVRLSRLRTYDLILGLGRPTEREQIRQAVRRQQEVPGVEEKHPYVYS